MQAWVTRRRRDGLRQEFAGLGRFAKREECNPKVSDSNGPPRLPAQHVFEAGYRLGGAPGVKKHAAEIEPRCNVVRIPGNSFAELSNASLNVAKGFQRQPEPLQDIAAIRCLRDHILEKRQCFLEPIFAQGFEACRYRGVYLRVQHCPNYIVSPACRLIGLKIPA